MVVWTSFIKDDILDWPLEEKDPSSRYFTLKHLLDKDENEKELIDAKRSIIESSYVTKILSKQDESG